jgi:hypothetical protein
MKTVDPKASFNEPLPGRSGARDRGSILVFALVILAVATLVLAGWVSVLSGTLEFAEAADEGMVRRIAMENSRGMAQQFLRASVLANGATSGVTNTNVTWGAFKIGGVLIPGFGANALQVNTLPIRWNPYSPAGFSVSGTGVFSGFSATVENARLYDGSGYETWTIQARSRAPVFGFDIADFPARTNSPGAVSVASAAAVGTEIGPRTSSGLLNVTAPPPIPSAIRMVTYSGSTATIGTTNVTVTSFSSTTLRLNDNSSQRDARLWTGTSSGTAILYVHRRANSRDPSNPIVYNITGSNTRGIVLSTDTGTVALSNPSSEPPLLIQCTSTSNPLTITVSGSLARPVYLRINNARECNIVRNGSGTPRMAGVFGGTLRVYSGTLRGGIQSFADSNPLGGTLNITRETGSLGTPASLFEFMANRQGWVEMYRND